MYKLGMNLLLWTDSVRLSKDKDLIDKVIGMGFDGLEIPVMDLSVDEARELGAYFKNLGVGCTTLSVLGGSNPISPDKEERESAYKDMCHFVDCSEAMGSKMLSGPFDQQLGYFSGARPTEQEWEWSIDVMRKSCRYALDKGVDIGIEPLNRFEQYLLNTAEDGVRYIKQLDMPNAGLLLDTMHLNVEELDIAKAFELGLPYTKHIHISENNRGIPGTGHACTKEVFDAIKASSYDGWLTIEAFNEGAPSMQGPLHLWRTFAPSDDALAEQGLAYIKEMTK